MENEVDDVDELSTKTRVESTYRQVWDEFYDWEQADCAYHIKTLDRTQEPDSLQEYLNDDEIEDDVIRINYFGNFCLRTAGSDDCLVTLKSGQKQTFTTDTFLVESLTPVIPTPIYESCSPTLINIGPRRLQVHHDETLGFFPLIEDQTFNQQEYADFFKFLAWDQEQDPDEELIVLETARRLLSFPDMTIKKIDQVGLLPRLRENELSGSLMVIAQRDTIPWVKNREFKLAPSIVETIQKLYQKHQGDAPGRFMLGTQTFCAHLGCMMDSCRTHGDSAPRFSAPNNVAMKTSYDLLQEVSEPCDSTCFKLMSVHMDDDKYSISWESKDEKSLVSILEVCPDILPCELKYACRKPCYEIYIKRKSLLSNPVIMQHVEEMTRTTQSIKKKRPNINKTGITHSYTPCRHAGACTENKLCECWNSGVYCNRACQCPTSCYQRWKGCKCKAVGKQKVCRLDKFNCPCVKAGRECDPELCRNCCSAACTCVMSLLKYMLDRELCQFIGLDHKSSPSCLNSAIQHRRRQIIRVSSSKTHGLGAYVCEPVKKLSLISEYNGYIYDKSEDLQAIDMVNRHNKRNYFFDAETHTIDSISVANEARFPNEAKDEPENGQGGSNCHSRTIFVNGQWKVGIFASRDIRNEEEILFDYGKHFELFD